DGGDAEGCEPRGEWAGTGGAHHRRRAAYAGGARLPHLRLSRAGDAALPRRRDWRCDATRGRHAAPPAPSPYIRMTEPRSSERPTVAITGASGFIGSALTQSFQRDGWRVLALSRSRATSDDQVNWDPEAGTIDAGALQGVSAVVHLAGESIDGRWTD